MDKLDDDINNDDCSKFTSLAISKDWKNEDYIESIRDRFVTGDWSKAARRGEVSQELSDDGDEDVFGEFEDLETGQKYDGHLAGDKQDLSMLASDDVKAIEERKLKNLALRAKFDSVQKLAINADTGCEESECRVSRTEHRAGVTRRSVLPTLQTRAKTNSPKWRVSDGDIGTGWRTWRRGCRTLVMRAPDVMKLQAPE